MPDFRDFDASGRISRSPQRFQNVVSAAAFAMVGALAVLSAVVLLRDSVHTKAESSSKSSLLLSRKDRKSTLLLSRKDSALQSLDTVKHKQFSELAQFSKDIMDQINTGNMKCCIRDGSDVPPPIYQGAYGDWPKILCVPGYMIDNTLPPGQDCVPCSAGLYCPMRSDYWYTCPSYLTSRPASVALTDCWCSPGFYGKAGVQACLSCPVDSFCPGQRDMPAGKPPEVWPGMVHPCPANSDTRGISNKANCTCRAGYFGGVVTDIDGRCTLCPANSYCLDGGSPVACIPRSQSPAGSTSSDQCTCVAGYELVGGACVTTCVASPGSYCTPQAPSAAADANPVLAAADCPAGYFCPGGRGADKSPCAAVAGNYCPARSVSLSGVPCPSGSYCPGGAGPASATAYPCPDGSDTRGQAGQSACSCRAGYLGGSVGAGGGACTPCPAGSYCPDGGSAVACIPRSQSPAGSASPDQCTCIAGYGLVAGACVTTCVAAPGSYCTPQAPSTAADADPILGAADCPAGYFCPGGRGADKSPCAAAPGSYCPGRTATADGVPCPSGSYCPGGAGASAAAAAACPANSDTRGQTGQAACTCVPGYRGGLVAATGACAACDAGSFCADGFGAAPCGEHASSPPGSAAASQCACVVGYEAVAGACATSCVAAPGSYCQVAAGVAAASPADPVYAAGTCPAGYYCTGGRGADKAPCTAAPGSFCPAGSTGGAGVQCPAGSFCAGGTSDRADCAVAPGLYCPAGSPTGSGAPCPQGYACAGGAADKAPCAAAPGSYCPAGSSAPVGVTCPQGSFCAGGAADAVPCAVDGGNYCPAVSSAPAGTQCPQGYYCAGGTADKAPCAAAPGNYCPAGTAASAGTACPQGFFCAGGAADKAPCTAAAGSYCPAGSSATDGGPCPAGFACPGTD